MRASFSSVAFALSVTAVLLVANHAAAQAPQPSIAPPPPGFAPAPPATAPGPPPGFAPVAPPPPGAAPYPQQPPIVYYPAPSPGLAPGATAQPAPPPPPAIMRYEEGDPIPAGYHLESRARMNIVGTGIGLFVPFYAISTLSAAIAEAGGNSNYWPMYIPTIGPVIAISTAKPENNFATFMLGLDTAAQTAGIGLIIWGMVAREKRLIRIADSLPALELAPLHFGRGSVGLGISGSL